MIALADSGDAREVRCSPEGLLRVASAPPIEVVYNIGSVPANASVFVPSIDLGPVESRQHTLILSLKIGVASPGEVFAIETSPDGIDWMSTNNASGATASAWSNSSGGTMHHQARPLCRYIRPRYQNGSTAQTALKLYLTALAGV
jgi:hypothetical protein